jgi:hypothetical protein
VWLYHGATLPYPVEAYSPTPIFGGDDVTLLLIPLRVGSTWLPKPVKRKYIWHNVMRQMSEQKEFPKQGYRYGVLY